MSTKYKPILNLPIFLLFFKGLQSGFLVRLYCHFMSIFILIENFYLVKNGRFRIQDWLLTCDEQDMILKCVMYQMINGFYSGRLDLLIFSSSKFFAFFPLNSAALMFLKYYIFVVRTYLCSSCTMYLCVASS